MRICLLLFVLTSCIQIIPHNIPKEEGPPMQVYFCKEYNCSAIIQTILSNATRVSCAFYHITDKNTIAQLKQMNARIITDNLYEKTLKGLNVRTDTSRALMHNKFCIIDEHTVLTGSYNPTSQQKEDNLISIPSALLAQNYVREFEEMWEGTFHAGNPSPYPKIMYDGAVITTAFCPEDSCAEKLLDALRRAQERIEFVLYQITDQKILNFLSATPLRVTGIIDRSQEKNIPASLKQHVKFQEKIHAKIFIIDNTTIVTGSYNPTRNGNTQNDENMLIIQDPVLAQKYISHFSSLVDG